MQPQQPQDFIQRKCQEGATFFALSVSLPEGAQRLLDRYPAAAGARDVLDRVEDRAHRHAQLGPTVALFVVEAVREIAAERNESLGCEVFRVQAQPPGARQLLTEPANEVGLLSQLMRHNEANTRMMQGSVASLLDHMHQQLAEARAREAEFAGARLKMVEVTEQMLSSQQERQLALEEHHSRAQMRREGFEKILTTGQTVAAAFLAKKGGAAGEEIGAATAVVRLFETLNQEQLMAMLGALRPEQQALVLTFIKSMTERRNKAKAEREQGNGATH